MPELFQYLEDTARRDTDLTWSWEKNQRPIPVYGREEVDQLMADLSPEEKSRVKLLTVEGWYRPSIERLMGKMFLFPTLTPVHTVEKQIVETHGLSKQPGVFKLLSTNATDSGSAINDPSFFVSSAKPEHSIRPGDLFIILDDTMGSGGTVRDLVRHINHRGGQVAGVVLSHSPSDFRSHLSDPKAIKNKIEHISKTALGMRLGEIMLPAEDWNSLAEEKKEEIIQNIKSSADKHLAAMGLTFDQLTVRELVGIKMELSLYKTRFPHGTLEGFWQEQLRDITPLLPLRKARVETPDILAKPLGVEYEPGKWAASTSAQRPRSPGDSGRW